MKLKAKHHSVYIISLVYHVPLMVRIPKLTEPCRIVFTCEFCEGLGVSRENRLFELGIIDELKRHDATGPTYFLTGNYVWISIGPFPTKSDDVRALWTDNLRLRTWKMHSGASWRYHFPIKMENITQLQCANVSRIFETIFPIGKRWWSLICISGRKNLGVKFSLYVCRSAGLWRRLRAKLLLATNSLYFCSMQRPSKMRF